MFAYFDKKDIVSKNIRLSDIYDEDLSSDLTATITSLDNTSFSFYKKLDVSEIIDFHKTFFTPFVETIDVNNLRYFNSLKENDNFTKKPYFDSTSWYVSDHTDSNIGPDGTISSNIKTPISTWSGLYSAVRSDENSLYGIVNDDFYFDTLDETLENKFDVDGTNKNIWQHMPEYLEIATNYDNIVNWEIQYLFNEAHIINDIKGKAYVGALTYEPDYDTSTQGIIEIDFFVFDSIESSYYDEANNSLQGDSISNPIKFKVYGLNTDGTTWELIGGKEITSLETHALDLSEIPIKAKNVLGIRLECELMTPNFGANDFVKLLTTVTNFVPGYNPDKYEKLSYNDYHCTIFENNNLPELQQIDASKIFSNYKYYSNDDVIKFNVNKEMFNHSKNYGKVLNKLRVDALTYNFSDFTSLDDSTIIETLNFDIENYDEITLDFTNVNILEDSTNGDVFLKYTLFYETDTVKLFRNITKNNISENSKFIFNNFENNFKLPNKKYFENNISDINEIEWYEFDSTVSATNIVKNNRSSIFIHPDIDKVTISNTNFDYFRIGIDFIKDSTIIDEKFVVDSTSITSDWTSSGQFLIHDSTIFDVDISILDTSNCDYLILTLYTKAIPDNITVCDNIPPENYNSLYMEYSNTVTFDNYGENHLVYHWVKYSDPVPSYTILSCDPSSYKLAMEVYQVCPDGAWIPPENSQELVWSKYSESYSSPLFYQSSTPLFYPNIWYVIKTYALEGSDPLNDSTISFWDGTTGPTPISFIPLDSTGIETLWPGCGNNEQEELSFKSNTLLKFKGINFKYDCPLKKKIDKISTISDITNVVNNKSVIYYTITKR